MNIQRPGHVLRSAVRCICVASALALSVWPAAATAQPKKKNMSGKIYVSDVSGDATIGTGDTFEDMNKRSVYDAQGAVIETAPASGKDTGKTYLTIVFSNGTAAFLDADTRLEIKRFAQEPFKPNRTDVEVEPSVSHTDAFVARGTIGLSTSKLVPGSTMTYQTPHGSVNIRGRKVVIETGPNAMKISMLDGEGSVRSGAADVTVYTVRAGEQAVIRRDAPGPLREIQITPIPPAEALQLGDSVAMAAMAKKTVYFEERVRKVETAAAAPETPAGQAAKAQETKDETAASAASGAVTAFDTDTSTTSRTTTSTVREIVSVEIVPTVLPTEYTVSPARLPGR
jgi:hypothetical protein